MAINNPIHYLLATIALLFASTLVLTHSAPPPPPPPADCTGDLMKFSPCLPYISNPPNNQSASPSAQCCDLFAAAFHSGTSKYCLCYLDRDNQLLGFPLNRTRLHSLSSLCLPKDNRSNGKHMTLESLCSDSRSRNLPPLRGSPCRRHPPPRPKPANPGPQKPPKSPGNPLMQLEPPIAPAPKSCASKQIISSIRLQPGIMMLIVSLYQNWDSI